MHRSTPDAPAARESEAATECPAVIREDSAPVLSPRARVGLGALGVLALAWISTWLEIPGEVPESRLPKRPAPPDLQRIVDLRAAGLDKNVPTFEAGRNIFTFASAPVERRSRQKDRGQRKIETRGEERDPSSKDLAPTFDFLGVFGSKRLRIGVLKDGKSVSNLLERDLVDDRYRVLEIDLGSILLRDTATPGAPSIRLEIP